MPRFLSGAQQASDHVITRRAVKALLLVVMVMVLPLVVMGKRKHAIRDFDDGRRLEEPLARQHCDQVEGFRARLVDIDVLSPAQLSLSLHKLAMDKACVHALQMLQGNIPRQFWSRLASRTAGWRIS